MIEDHNPELSAKCMKIVECDTARIRRFEDGNMFLIIGFNRNTKDDPGVNLINGIPSDWDYVAEKVVSSGSTEEELIESATEYKRLYGMTMPEYLEELTGQNPGATPSQTQ